MQVLKTIGLVEEHGEGIDRMYREMESRLMEPPTFKARASSVPITLRYRFLGAAEYRVWLMRAGKRLAVMRMHHVDPTVEGLIDRAIVQRTKLGNGATDTD